MSVINPFTNLPPGCRMLDSDGRSDEEEDYCPNCRTLFPTSLLEEHGGLCDECRDEAKADAV